MRYLIFIFILVSGSLWSQDSLTTGKKIKLSSVNVKIGVIGTNEHRFSIDDFDKLSPTPFTEPLPGINTNLEPGRTYFSGGAKCAFRIYDPNTKNYSPHEFHIGVYFQAKDDAKIRMNDRQNVRFDTLYSSQTGDAFFIDTLKKFGYEYVDVRNNYLIELGYSIHTRQDRVLSLYTGIQAGFGRHITHKVTKKLDYSEEFVDQTNTSYDYPAGQHSRREISSSTTISPGNIVTASIPVGGIIRFARPSKNIVAPFSFNFELMAGMRYEEIPGLDSFTSAYWNLNVSVKYFLSSEPLRRSYRNFFSFY